MTTAVFLPGAGGRISFWQPAASLVSPGIETLVLGWPGFGDVPRDESISGIDGLVGFVRSFISEPVDLVAQSMGGVVAITLALEHPRLVRRIVLTGTSGGIDIARFGGEDWRAESLANDVDVPEGTPRWFIDDRSDLTDRIATITAPVLLVWGENDAISPPSVGRYLASLLTNAVFTLVPGGHDHPFAHPNAISEQINRHLVAPSPTTSRALP
jgi:pimeloyl-ACP methyl ester carboxylesterase